MLIVTFHNDGTGTEDVGNYDWGVFVNKRLLARGRIEGHQRNAGWEGLMRDFVKALRNKKNTTYCDV